MKKILVPVDFSRASRNASEYAALLAKAVGAEIHLLHVYKDLMPATVGPEPWTVTVSGLQSKNEVQINKEIEFLKKKYSINVNGDAKRGLKTNSIKKVAKEIGADVIVMAMKGGKKSKILTGTPLKAIRKLNTPVLIISENTAFLPVKNVVLAVDFREVNDSSCFDPLIGIVKKFDASLRVLHVEEKGADINAAEMPGKLELGRILGKVSYLYDKIENDDVEQGIQHFVQDHPTDLLVIVAHHHNIFEQIFGSVLTRSISVKIKLPLLILKDK
jgi:nucleotide-binding universal stress UspA family protein